MPPGHVKLGYDFHGQLLKEVTRRYKERFLFGTTLYEAERSLRASVPSGPVWQGRCWNPDLAFSARCATNPHFDGRPMKLPSVALQWRLRAYYDDQPSFPGGNGEDGTVRAAQYSFGRAAAQGIEKVQMSLRSEHHEVGMPVTLGL